MNDVAGLLSLSHHLSHLTALCRIFESAQSDGMRVYWRQAIGLDGD